MLDLLSMFGSSMRDGIPGLNAVVFKIANGFLVFSQRLEAYEVKRWKPQPMYGPPAKPRQEVATLHRVRFATTYCATLNAVREAQEIAEAELAKIAAWRRAEQGKEHGGAGYCG